MLAGNGAGHPGLLAALVWPQLFAAGAGAVSIPILIHFFARRRFRRIRWAAMEFLLDAERRNRRRVRLEELILLLLRCLAVLLIGLLVARPFFKPEGLAALLGGSERTERVLVIDDSFSMAYETPEGTVFDTAKQAATRLIDLLRTQSPNDTVTVLRASEVESPVASGVFLNAEQTQDLRERIEGLQVSQQPMAANEVFASLAGTLDEQPATLNAAIYMFSDFQRGDWVRGSGSAEAAPSPIAPLASVASGEREIRLVLVDVGADAPANRAVTRLVAARSRFVSGVAGEIRATVANYSEAPVRDIDLEVTVGTVSQPTVTVERLQGGDATQVPLTVSFPRPGFEPVQVALPHDALPLDDQRALAVETVEAVRTLIVNGEPSTDVYRDEVALLRTALRPPGEVFSGNEVEVVDETELEELDLTRYDVVVLANVYRVSDLGMEKLSRFAQEGGGVVVFLGDQVDVEFYNEVLYAEGLGLLPARLGERTTPPSGAVAMVPDDALHPMIRVFSGRDNPFVKHIRFEQYFRCRVREAASAESGAGGGGVDASAAATRPDEGQARVIAHFEDGSESPAIVESTYGLGRVTLITTTCDQEWNDWAKDASFVVSMLELNQRMARGPVQRSEQLVGGAIRIGLDPARFERDVLVRTPSYPAEREVSLTAAPAEDGRGLEVVWDRTETAGIYQFLLTDTSGRQVVRQVAVNLDASESDLTRAGEAALRVALHEIPFSYVDGLKSLRETGDQARREFWRSVLLAVVMVLMCEQGLAWYFGRRA